MRKKFQEWYGNIICQQLHDAICEEVDMRLSRMNLFQQSGSLKWLSTSQLVLKWFFHCWYFRPFIILYTHGYIRIVFICTHCIYVYIVLTFYCIYIVYICVYIVHCYQMHIAIYNM